MAPEEKSERTYHSGKLAAGHLDDAGIVGLGDAEVLLVEIHQLHLVVGHFLLVGGLKHEGDGVRLVLGLDGDDVIIRCAPEREMLEIKHTLDVSNLLEDLVHAVEIHPHGELPVAPEPVEAISSETDGDEGDVGVVHSLQLDAAVAAVPGRLLQQLLDRVQHLLQKTALDESGLEHLG